MERRKNMELRKLEREEHGLTRQLWEDVFVEDTKEFLDYYYTVKTADNEIYVVEDQNKIRAMIHLNPYKLWVEDKKIKSDYIIAVATEEAYRRKGLMGQLLRRTMRDMYDRKEAFTFLMPAAEAIYTPYDFRFVFDQKQISICGEDGEKKKLSLREAECEDAKKLSGFAKKLLKERYQVYAVRNKKYYETMIREQRSECGGVKMVMSKKELVGFFAYAREENYEIREPLFLPEYEDCLTQTVQELTGDASCRTTVYGADHCGGEAEGHPMIMVRILHLKTLLETLRLKEDVELHCSFAVIDTFLEENTRIWSLCHEKGEEQIMLGETEDSDGVFTIAAFTSFLFGYKTLDEVEREEGVILTDHLRGELGKIRLLKDVFLNEVV
ncbi:GNAT family N-acetyltransferase [Hespellia stercorisuis]|uniref:Predicted acetyltransferase n=1 Tax=Hespellia stercorisuis DSM 15480 TaxID=1121950 RepID=A0A1M6PFF0_9FIRM|nr:GNAT family N-acetyltransferase [Hespellia stercorisuis]SHK06644.1 Predicted acetyltransferase [Hespellia stercorisuis DSM 15480]